MNDDEDTSALYPHGLPPYRMDPHDPNAPGTVLWHDMPMHARAAGLYLALRTNMDVDTVELRYNRRSSIVFAICDHPADKTKKKIMVDSVSTTADVVGSIQARFGVARRRQVENLISRRRR